MTSSSATASPAFVPRHVSRRQKSRRPSSRRPHDAPWALAVVPHRAATALPRRLQLPGRDSSTGGQAQHRLRQPITSRVAGVESPPVAAVAVWQPNLRTSRRWGRTGRRRQGSRTPARGLQRWPNTPPASPPVHLPTGRLRERQMPWARHGAARRPPSGLLRRVLRLGSSTANRSWYRQRGRPRRLDPGLPARPERQSGGPAPRPGPGWAKVPGPGLARVRVLAMVRDRARGTPQSPVQGLPRAGRAPRQGPSRCRQPGLGRQRTAPPLPSRRSPARHPQQYTCRPVRGS